MAWAVVLVTIPMELGVWSLPLVMNWLSSASGIRVAIILLNCLDVRVLASFMFVVLGSEQIVYGTAR